MGIRIHKVLGYGFRKCRFEKDPRFSEGIFSTFAKAEDLKEKFISYIENKMDNLPSKSNEKFELKMLLAEIRREGLWEKINKEDFNFYDVIRSSPYQEETGIGSIIFTNPLQEDWSRYDDTIDYYDAETREDGSPKDTIKMIVDCENQSCGIYPYSARYINRNTGEPLKNVSTFDRWFITQSFKKGGKNPPFKDNNEFGLKNLIEWQRHIVPTMCPFVSEFCDAFKIFKNPLTKYRLKPMILTYWS